MFQPSISRRVFAAIASQVLKRLKEPTAGILYNVDTRLRPDGNKGSVDPERARQYYLEEAYPWEKFALMKVRAVAGDPAFMARAEAEARHIAFSMRPDRAALEELESMRTRLAATVSKLDLKRREGGIAEIEFATRLLQLRHVAGNPDLERGGVFGALAVLAEKGLLSELACETLRAGYAFFRHLLNRARMMRGSSSSCLRNHRTYCSAWPWGLASRKTSWKRSSRMQSPFTTPTGPFTSPFTRKSERTKYGTSTMTSSDPMLHEANVRAFRPGTLFLLWAMLFLLAKTAVAGNGSR